MTERLPEYNSAPSESESRGVEVETQDSKFLKVTGPDDKLRQLMQHMHSTGIVPQNYFSESKWVDATDREMFIWLDPADALELEAWIQANLS